MAALQPPERFLVAFSYAGEQRELVSGVAHELAQSLGQANVFFAEWWEHYLAGGDADLKLQELYENATVVVVCVSERYGDKAWTRAEHAAIRARLMKAEDSGDENDKLGVLPVRVGEGDVGGLPFNTIIPDIRLRTHREAAALVIDRLALVGAGHDVGGIDPKTSAGYRTHCVEAGDSLDRIASRHLGSPTEWRRIALANRLTDPLAIWPGQLIIIPHVVSDDG
jgi:nucleoid-associated protein YgaU